MSDWYADGRSITHLPLGDRSMLYGDGVFETIAIRDGKPRLWQLHAERLSNACERLGLTVPGAAGLEREVLAALAKTSLDTRWLTARLTVTAGGGPRGYRRPEDARPGIYVALSDGARLDRRDYRDGMSVRLCSTPVSVQPRLAGIKSLNRLDQVLARQEWRTPEPREGLMLDVDGNLICGTMSNVFLVHDNAYSTPLLDRSGVAGVMRRHVMNLLGDGGVPCKERRLTLADLDAADEVFLTNSQVGAVPVAAIDERRLVPGPATRRVQGLLARHGVPECEP